MRKDEQFIPELFWQWEKSQWTVNLSANSYPAVEVDSSASLKKHIPDPVFMHPTDVISVGASAGSLATFEGGLAFGGAAALGESNRNPTKRAVWRNLATSAMAAHLLTSSQIPSNGLE
jgi:hypothetical protein